MQRLLRQLIAPMVLSVGVLLCGYGLSACAATYVPSAFPAGPQCETVWVNDSEQTVGKCNSATPSANAIPWYSSTLAGPQQALAPLSSRKPCEVSAISNNGGWVVGNCANANNLFFAVLWNAATPGITPITLAPLPPRWLLLIQVRPADTQTAPIAQNRNGAVLAVSLSADFDATVVVYSAGSTTPQRVSDWGDNCYGVDLTETLTNGWPRILLNCPGPSGKPVVTLATWSTGSNQYVLTPASLPAGALDCEGVDMNDQGQFVGTCTFPGTAADTQQTAFWSTASSTPLLLTMPLNAQNHAVAINNLGHVLAYGNDPTGFQRPLYWNDPTNSFSVQSIPPLPGSDVVQVAAFADNDTVALNCVNSSEYPTGCYWTPLLGTVPISPISGGLASYLNAISPAGTYVVGSATGATFNFTAVGAKLP
ncbi:hypothetical protein cym2001_27300 [Pseudomonas sp. CYM-20-01]|uniref:hypothetical protein n=1 Tax=Pseudomonas sp. CYM-20-01 TaxID=2870750 RepID=UPI00204CB494|nr:hypothetical protein [Pseudomonas sp. CYM-20-01]BDB19365.1 hypothetical protein cym2001_27300 [Pseudomonas sp. CYM-20-01]